MQAGGAMAIFLALAFLSWLGLLYLILNTDPREAVGRLRFLGVLFLALTFSLVPFFHYWQFRSAPVTNYREDLFRSVRRGGLMALFLSLLAWLRMNGTLNAVNALILFWVMVLTEVLIQMRR